MKFIDTTELTKGRWNPALTKTFGLVIFIVQLAGCTSTQLERNTVAQTQTVIGMEYEMVLSNVAMFNQAPDSLPWHLNISTGTVTINDGVTSSLSYASKQPAAKASTQLTGTVGANASRAWQGQWSVFPVGDTKQLKKLQTLYNSVVNHTWKTRDGTTPPPDWFNKGVSPRGLAAPYGKYGSTFVWVDEANRKVLVDLTCQVLEIVGKPSGTLLEMQLGPGFQIQ